jgi:solute carrier family 45 protein 1/2/4
MIFGSILVTACLLVMGWTKEIVLFFVEEGDFAKLVLLGVSTLLL